MESEILKNFISQAEIYLPMIRNGILVCSQEGNLGGELETARYYSQAIRDAGAAAGLENIGQAAARLESAIRAVAGSRDPLSDAQTRELLDNLAQLEALLAKLQFSTDDLDLNFDGFVEESFINLGFDTPAADSAAAADESFLEGFEIDEEMLEIFGMEADDLLRNINTHLEILQSAPSNRESLLEIRRNAHTLKGSAGIVGLQALSRLAHRVEDLLDQLAEKQIEGNTQIFELLQSATDCLGALASGENSAQMSKRIDSVYRNFDEVLRLLESPGLEKGLTMPRAAEPKPEFAAAKAENHAVLANPKSVIRVSLEKLDELVRLVGDLVVSRSIFEQRLAEFEHQIGELQHTTGRLLRSTGKLETDFEADLLSADFGMRISDFTTDSEPFSLVRRSNEYSGPLSQIRSQPSFDALEFDRYTEFHQTTRELLETAGDASAINTELDKLRSNLEMLFGNQSRLIEEMHDRLLHLRMIRFGSLSSRLQRTARVTCDEEKKQVELVIEGEQTEVDSQILDLLVEPLLHLLRNAVAHGIESPDMRRMLGKAEKGRIFVRMHSEGTHIILTVSDDGRGISAVALREKAVRNGFIAREEAEKMSDEEAFSLGFMPGLTTADAVSQTSGRGVGMNIIKTSVLRGQGTISIASEPQKGTTFTIRMPMALAIMRGLIVKISGQTYAFPLKLVKKISEISVEDFVCAASNDSLSIDGDDYKLTRLGTLLNLPAPRIDREIIPLILHDGSDVPRALMVDEIVRAEEIVIKPLAAPLQNYPNLLGATILGDGNVVPVLDLVYLLKNQAQPPRFKAAAPENGGGEPLPAIVPDAPPAAPEPRPVRVMIVDDSPSVRHMTSKLIKNAGWEFVLAKDGLEAIEALQTAEIKPDIVLTDVEMPRMNGYELLAAIRGDEALQNLPVIMITSRASDKHQERAIELGVSQYLTKPFNDAVLLETIEFLTLLEPLQQAPA